MLTQINLKPVAPDPQHGDALMCSIDATIDMQICISIMQN